MAGTRDTSAPPAGTAAGDSPDRHQVRGQAAYRWGVFACLGVLTVLAAVYAVYVARAVLVRALVALFFAVSLDPAVRWLTRRGMGRGTAVTIIFVLVLAVVVAFLVSIIPPLVSQFQTLATDLPRLQAGLVRLMPRARRARSAEVVGLVVGKVGDYMIGNILISVVAGIASYLAFLVIHVPFAIPLAILVAFTDLIPMVGATLGAVACVAVAAFAASIWPTAVLAAAFFVAYQQLENYLIAPRILRSTVDISAAAVLLAGLVGATVLGLVGALMAIPVAAAMKVLYAQRVAAEAAGPATPPADTGPEEGARAVERPAP